jgi:hypothetical protein
MKHTLHMELVNVAYALKIIAFRFIGRLNLTKLTNIICFEIKIVGMSFTQLGIAEKSEPAGPTRTQTRVNG